MFGAYECKKNQEKKYSADEYLEVQDSKGENADALFNIADGDFNESEDGRPASLYEHSFFLDPETDDFNINIFPNEATDNNPVASNEINSGLKKIIEAEFKKKLPQFTEYKSKGYNTQGIDQKAIRNLEEILQETASLKRSPVQENLSGQAVHFLKSLASLSNSSESTKSQKTIHQANRLTGMITVALAALNAAGQVRGDWETRTGDVVSQQLNRLSGEAIKRIGEAGALPVSNENASRLRQQLEGILFSKSHDHVAENIKFSKLRNSLLAEDKITRTRLATYLDHRSEQILTGARDAMQYAMQDLYGGQSVAYPDYGEWAGYAGHAGLPAFEAEQTGAPASARVSRAMLSVSETLKEVALTLRQQAADLRPSEEKTIRVDEDLVDQVISFIKRSPKKINELNKEIRFTAHLAGNQAREAAGAVGPRLSLQPVVSSGSGKSAIKATALLLLDELHQIERRIKLLPAFAQELQEAVEQRQSLRTQTVARPAQPVLDELLDEQLKKEEARWSGRAEQAQEKLAALVAPLVRFTQEKWAEDFCYALAEVLLSPKPAKTGEWKGRQQFQQISDGIVRGIAAIAREVDGSAVRLARHGNAGGEELIDKAGQWLRQLKVLETRVSAGVAEITGAPLDYYSRGGMLARGVAEWAEELKQAYLQKANLEDRDAETALFEQVLMEVVGENRDYFQKKSDPESVGFLQRLKIELKHAAQNTTVYPPTPEDILAGARTVPEEIRRWAEKKVVSGAISAAIRQGFKIVSGSLSLPGRLVMRGARTGLTLYRGKGAINRGVRVGQGPVTQIEKQFIIQELSKAAFKLTMSLSPAAAWGLAASITVERLYNEDKYGKKLITKTLTDLPEDLLWRGGYAGISRVFQTLFTHAIEQSDNRESQQLPNDGRSPAEAAETRFSRGLNPLINRDAGFTHYVRPDEHNDHNESEGDRGHRIRKRAVAKDTTGSKRPDFDRLMNYRPYSELPDNVKKATYFYAIKNVLLQIENDESLPQNVRNNAYLARIGAPKLVPVDILKYKINNAFLIPDNDSAKSGVLVRIGAPQPYYYVKKGSDLGYEIADNLPYNANEPEIEYEIGTIGQKMTHFNGNSIFNKIRTGEMSFEKYFNYNSPEQMDIATLSKELSETIEADFKHRPQKIENKNVIQRAIAGSQIPDPEVSAEQVRYQLEFTWENLTPAEYLRSYSRPFATLGGQMQLIVSDANGDSIQKTEKNVERAQYIGTWIDVSIGVVTSFSGAGIVFGLTQSAAEIAADIAEGKDPDPLAVAGLIVGCIPGNKITAGIGKFSKIGAKSVKYGLLIGNKSIDLAVMGRSIKTAVDSGEPLAIYQAFIASGMNMKDAHDITTNMVSKLKIKKGLQKPPVSLPRHDIEHSVKYQAPKSSVKQTSKKINNKKMRKVGNITLPANRVHKFTIGQTEMLGRQNHNTLEISRDNGVTWALGNNIHKFAYVLQNAGGKSKLPEAQDTASPGPSTLLRDRTKQDFREHLERGQDPDKFLQNIKSTTPNEKEKRFNYFGKSMTGRVQDGVFEISRNGGKSWKKSAWMKEISWRLMSRDEISVEDLDKKINRASRKNRAYSLSCYINAFNDAAQAGVISRKQANWLKNKIAKPDSKGEIIGSERYRQSFGLQNKEPLSTYESGKFTESGFMHIGERRPDGTVVYDHVVYVHVADNGEYLYQANGSDFLLALNGPDPLEKHNKIGAYTSRSHYKHYMDQDRIRMFNEYFAKLDPNDSSQAVFVFTPASEARKYYVEQSSLPVAAKIIKSEESDAKILHPQDDAGSTLQNREPVITEYSYKDLSLDDKKFIQDTNNLLRLSMGSDFTTYSMKPKDNSVNAVRSVRKILQNNGYTDVGIFELGIWVNGGKGTTPANHYVVQARKESTEFVVDLTAGQFEQYGFTGPVIDTKNNWIAGWQQAMKSKPRTLVKLIPVTGGLSSSPFSSFSPYIDVWETVPNGQLMNSPAWYKNTNSVVVRAPHADSMAEINHIDEEAGVKTTVPSNMLIDSGSTRSTMKVAADYKFPEKWAVRNTDLDYIKPEKGIYKLSQAGSSASEPGYKYYIKRDGLFFGVRFDSGNNTWRLIDPAHSGQFEYAVPVRLNEEGDWITHNDVGLRGGGKIKDLYNKITGESETISIGDYQFKEVKYNKQKLNEVIKKASTYKVDPHAKGRIAKAQQDYAQGKKNFNEQKYSDLDNHSLDEKFELFLSDDTPALKKGVLSGKINTTVKKINDFEIAKKASDWAKSATKASETVIIPQNLFLKGQNGECLPESVLMGWALQRGQDKKFARNLLSMYSAEDVANNSLYKSLTELHANSNASKFNAPDAHVQGIESSNIARYEQKLFPDKTGSVRVDAPQHTMLLSKIRAGSDNVKYVFYDPNYGMAYFNKYKDMASFFEKKMIESGYSVNFYKLNFSNVDAIKVNGKNLSQIIMGDSAASVVSKNADIVPAVSVKITYHLSEEIPAEQYLSTMRKDATIAKKIDSPAGQCESLMSPVSHFMKDNGFVDIRYRGMYIWNNATEQIPMNHFVVVGKKDGKDFVFDISAHQFENKGMADLDGPLILSAEEWENKYRGATTRKLIYYSDFTTQNDATKTYDALPGHTPLEQIAGRKNISVPGWYNTLQSRM